MACETSHLHIPFSYQQVKQNGDNAGNLSPQMLQRLSRLPYFPSSEPAITNILDDGSLNHDKDPMDQSSIRFPTTSIYHYDSSSSNSSASSTPSDESHIIVSRSRRIRGTNSSTAPVSHTSSPTPLSIKSRNNHRIRGQTDSIKDGRRAPELSDTFDAETTRPLQGLKQSSDHAGCVKLGSPRAHSRQFSSEMRVSSLPHIDSHPRTQFGDSNIPQQMPSVRKKSGEPIKPSLKRPKLPSLSMPTGNDVVQSEPTTPTLSKAVHFDAKLEHVKLFLTKQKPLAVSRDHDVTTDTSGTESDFPFFVRGPPEDCPEKQIELQTQNMPSVLPVGVDVVLQKLTLSHGDKTIIGRVRVRNIAYEKWIAARFTLDLWQTTSEVTARYTETVDGGSFDIFTFSIRLHDIWARIEEKTMLFALRYSVAGKQFWDNNNGANYMLRFIQKPPIRMAPVATNLIMEDLSARVASASIDVDPLQTSPLTRSAPHETSLLARCHPGTVFKVGGMHPPGTRASCPTELSSVWSKHTPRAEKIPQRHSRAVTIGSPRELEKQEHVHVLLSDSVEFESSSMLQSRTGHGRNPRRVDRPMDGLLRKNPPSTALLSLPEVQSPTRNNDPIKGKPSLFERFTARTVTRASNASSAVSAISGLSTPLTSLGPDIPDPDSEPNDSYNQFLSQFCFFTGSNSPMDHSFGPITRSQSTSDVELLRSHSPSHRFSFHLCDAAFNGHRSSSLDNITASHTQRANAILESAA